MRFYAENKTANLNSTKITKDKQWTQALARALKATDDLSNYAKEKGYLNEWYLVNRAWRILYELPEDKYETHTKKYDEDGI